MSNTDIGAHLFKYKEDLTKRLQNEYNLKIDEFYTKEVDEIRNQIRRDEQNRYNDTIAKMQRNFEEKYSILKNKEQNLEIEQLEFSNYVENERKSLELSKQLLMQNNSTTLALIEEKRASLVEKERYLNDKERELGQKDAEIRSNRESNDNLVAVEIDKYKNSKMKSIIDKEAELANKLKLLESNHINLTNLKNEVEQLYAQKQTTEAKLREIESENTKLTSENKRLSKMYLEMKADAEGLSKYMEKHRNAIERYQNKIDSLENENFYLSKTVRELNVILQERGRLHNTERAALEQKIRYYQNSYNTVNENTVAHAKHADNNFLDKPVVEEHNTQVFKKIDDPVVIQDENNTSIDQPVIPTPKSTPKVQNNADAVDHTKNKILKELAEDTTHNALKNNTLREIEDEAYKKEKVEKERKEKRFMLENLYNVIKSESILVDTLSKQNTLREMKEDKLKVLEEIDASGNTEDILDEF